MAWNVCLASDLHRYIKLEFDMAKGSTPRLGQGQWGLTGAERTRGGTVIRFSVSNEVMVLHDVLMQAEQAKGSLLSCAYYTMSTCWEQALWRHVKKAADLIVKCCLKMDLWNKGGEMFFHAASEQMLLACFYNAVQQSDRHTCHGCGVPLVFEVFL